MSIPKKDSADIEKDFDFSREKAKSPFSVFILVILLVVAVGGFIWSFAKYQNAKNEITFLSTQEGQLELAQKEVEKLLEQVKKLILLPVGEPVVATIQDAAALAKQQAFYADAQNEDKLLIYKDKAIIYSPARNIIVNVGPVFIQEGDELRNAAEVLEEQDTRMTVEVRNGTPTAGLARSGADILDQNVYNVVGIGDAANNDYTQTIVVNLGGVDTSALIAGFGGQGLSTLPEGEAASTADVVVILGQPKAE